MLLNAIGSLIWFLMFLGVAWQLTRSIRVVPQRREYIVERLGKYHETLTAGFHVLIPFVDKVAYIQDLKEMAVEVPPQECFTKDNVKVEVDGIIYMRVEDSQKASYNITDYAFAASKLAQTTTRSVIGQLELDRTFEEREAINERVVAVLDEVADTWGVKVERYEVKNIVPPMTVKDAMERQMAAERERRAIIARTEGQRDAMINASEGSKMELINRSEGERTRRVNEAEGKAEEILAIAEATAESIRKLGAAMVQEGGAEAIRLRLAQQYIKNLQGVARDEARILLPADISNIDDLLKGVGLDAATAEADAERLAKEFAALSPEQRAALKVPKRKRVEVPKVQAVIDNALPAEPATAEAAPDPMAVPPPRPAAATPPPRTPVTTES